MMAVGPRPGASTKRSASALYGGCGPASTGLRRRSARGGPRPGQGWRSRGLPGEEEGVHAPRPAWLRPGQHLPRALIEAEGADPAAQLAEPHFEVDAVVARAASELATHTEQVLLCGRDGGEAPLAAAGLAGTDLGSAAARGARG